MNWFNIFKREKTGWQPERKPGSAKPRRKLPIKQVGHIRDVQDSIRDDPVSTEDEEMNLLAEGTREDLMDIVMEKIGAMDKEELIRFLVVTQGDLSQTHVSPFEE